MAPKTLHIKVGDPDGLEAVEDSQRAIQDNLKNLKNLARGSYVKVSIGLGRKTGELNRGKIRGIISWLLEQRDRKKGKVGTLKVEGADKTTIDDQKIKLNFLRAQMGGAKDLQLDDVTPEEGFKRRVSFAKQTFLSNEQELKTFKTIE